MKTKQRGWLTVAAVSPCDAGWWPAITFAAPVVFEAVRIGPRRHPGDVPGFSELPRWRQQRRGRHVPGWPARDQLGRRPRRVCRAEQPAGQLLQQELSARRGLLHAGSGFQVSGNAGVAPIEFDNLRPDASSIGSPIVQSPAVVHGAGEPDHGGPLLRPRHGPGRDQLRVRRRLHSREAR